MIREIRGGEIGLVFQEPMSSLSAFHTIGNQLLEAIGLHSRLSKRAARERAIELLRMVGIPRPEQRIDSYSFELSGGLRQRVMMALALAGEPRILIADEPTTALDVTTQAQILDLMRRLREERGLAVILITHDMGVIAEMADDVVVMYLGREVEKGPVDAIFHEPRHPYTQSLLRSIPSVLAAPRSRLAHHRRLDPASLRAAAGLPLPSALPVLHAGSLRPGLSGRDPAGPAPHRRLLSLWRRARDPGTGGGRVSGAAAPAHAGEPSGPPVLDVRDLKKFYPDPSGPAAPPGGRGSRGRRGELQHPPGRDPLAGGRERVRQDHDLALHPPGGDPDLRARSASGRKAARRSTWPPCRAASCARCVARCR